MFHEAENFNQDISSWNTSSVTNMSHMFYGASSFNGDISSWDTSLVKCMDHMFDGARSFNQDISNWSVSNLKRITGMFVGAEKLDPEISTKLINRILIENDYELDDDDDHDLYNVSDYGCCHYDLIPTMIIMILIIFLINW